MGSWSWVFEFFLVYLLSINLDGNSICSAVKFPVPVGTPLISPLVQWDHAQTWDVPKVEDFSFGSGGSNSSTIYNIGMKGISGYPVIFRIFKSCFLFHWLFCVLVSNCSLTHKRHKSRVSGLLPDWTLHWWACHLSSHGLFGAGLAYLDEKSGGCHGNHSCNLWWCHHPQGHHPPEGWWEQQGCENFGWEVEII